MGSGGKFTPGIGGQSSSSGTGLGLGGFIFVYIYYLKYIIVCETQVGSHPCRRMFLTAKMKRLQCNHLLAVVIKIARKSTGELGVIRRPHQCEDPFVKIAGI